jgi:mevalonate kinase
MYKGNGKLLLSGEYFVLNGANALALPTRMGQSFKVKEQSRGYDLVWKSYDKDDNLWFEAKYSLYNFNILQSTDEEKAQWLGNLIQACCKQNSEFLSTWKGYQVISKIEYPIQWGLGSSSTLINFLAEWADINPYILLFDTLGGSGYDVACARAEGPLIYQMGEEAISINHLGKSLPGAKYLYFVFSGNSQDTYKEIENYTNKTKPSKEVIDRISKISEEFGSVSSYNLIIDLVEEHEDIISAHLEKPKTKDRLFPDFWGQVKSLGAWGGDFYLAVSNKGTEKTQQYFNEKGYNVFFEYDEIIL